MLDINKLRKTKQKILSLGSHPGIIQSILDFDYLTGKEKPSLEVIIANGRKFERYFFGKNEILIPVFPTVKDLLEKFSSISLFMNVVSARRALASTLEIFQELPQVDGGVIFAEDVPEKHALTLYGEIKKRGKFVIGPASVGILIPGELKLGAIGGVDYRQFAPSHLFTPGSVAVFCASGGLTNEIIRIVTSQGKRISFGIHFGGDRFPVMTPKDAFLAAQADPNTKIIVYSGELGGLDEYEIASLIKTKKVTKEVICYIAGSIAELFAVQPQFGHAKAMAATKLETAAAKRNALKEAGAKVGATFSEFIELIKQSKTQENSTEIEYTTDMMHGRRHALITTSISKDKNGQATILKEDLLSFALNHTLAYEVASMLLGKKIKSKELEEFVDFVLRLLVDHGPYVSGAVNTIVAARAGRDLVSSLTSGLLTIGPRFGGAINEAAGNWLKGVAKGQEAAGFVEEFAKEKKYISGIGHKKYRSDFPDPRVEELLSHTKKLAKKQYTEFAKAVEKETTAKKGNLILNVDGAIAAVLLDILSEKEGMDSQQLQQLVEIEFFNALFVLSRSVGFMAHFLDQKRFDEGLLRLDEDMVLEVDQ